MWQTWWRSIYEKMRKGMQNRLTPVEILAYIISYWYYLIAQRIQNSISTFLGSGRNSWYWECELQLCYIDVSVLNVIYERPKIYKRFVCQYLPWATNHAGTVWWIVLIRWQLKSLLIDTDWYWTRNAQSAFTCADIYTTYKPTRQLL